jgi:hypothetical protein
MRAKPFFAKNMKSDIPAMADASCVHPLSLRDRCSLPSCRDRLSVTMRSFHKLRNEHDQAILASRSACKRISVSLVVLLLCTALLAACTNGTATSNSQEDTTTSTTSNSSFFGGITQLKMFDASNGWATSSSAVLKTNDGGQHWTDVTPADWEATTTSQDGSSNPNNKGVSAAFFLNAQDAWIVTSNSSSVEDQIAATAEASSTPTINAQMQVYVRATTDGGSTWVDANPITVTNLSLLYPPYFINPHEGWLVLTATNTQGNQRSALVYHSTNGGITWQQISTLSGISSSDSVAGLTMAPNCPSQCPASSPVSSPGCTTNGTSDTFGWLAYANKSSLWLKETNDSGSLWSNLDWSTPGGAPGQSNDSLIVAAPPILFTDGTGVLPIQMQSNPDSNDPSNFYLHLYKMSLNGSAGALQTNLSSTSPFVVQQIAAYHTLSAPDLSHIFVLGQTLNGDTSSNTHLYEWNGSSWQTLTSQISSTDATSGSDLSSLDNGSSPTNLDFISDTEGWATSDSSLYHILLNGTTASWTQVYPPANSTNTVTRTPGQVLSAPANPTACDNTSTHQTSQSGPSPTTGPRSFIIVNNTSQTIWAAIAGNAGFTTPANGGWIMPPGSTYTVKVANNWQGRIWGRTYCSFDSSGNGSCETGDCGHVLQCNGATASSPQTLAEFTLDGAGGNDFYDVSDVDGFNLPVTITPVGGAAPDPNNIYRCGTAGCDVDMNADCPTALQDKDSSGRIVGCNSPCAVFHTDQYCCEGIYVGAVCNPKTWPVDYAAYFKGKCPTSYSYAYDDATSTFTDTNANYRITFGP